MHTVDLKIMIIDTKFKNEVQHFFYVGCGKYNIYLSPEGHDVLHLFVPAAQRKHFDLGRNGTIPRQLCQQFLRFNEWRYI